MSGWLLLSYAPITPCAQEYGVGQPVPSASRFDYATILWAALALPPLLM